jgi:hypothetical protein
VYFGGSKLRMEVTAEGQQMTIIADPASGSMLMIMPEQRMYMQMAAGMAPVAAPQIRSMDPANPCSGGEATGCMSLGEESVNGYPSRKWQYQIDGETQTAWISTQHRFAVRLVSGDGTTTDYSNVTPGPQPASLFSAPAGFTQMEMGPMTVLGMGSGRGVSGGGGRGTSASGMAGIPPEVLAGMDSATVAMMMGALSNPGSVTIPAGASGGTPWEEGDGWIAEFTLTVSGDGSGTTTGAIEGTWQGTYSGEFKASVPITYGTPGTASLVNSVGPAWQLVPSLGSPKGLAVPATFTATTQSRREGSWSASCPVMDGGRTVVVTRGSAQLSADQSVAQGSRWQLSADLKTHQLSVGMGGPVSESSETQSTTTPCLGGAPVTTNERQTAEVPTTVSINLSDLPLPAAPGPMSGTGRVPLRVKIGWFEGETQANVQWSLRQIR